MPCGWEKEKEEEEAAAARDVISLSRLRLSVCSSPPLSFAPAASHKKLKKNINKKQQNTKFIHSAHVFVAIAVLLPLPPPFRPLVYPAILFGRSPKILIRFFPLIWRFRSLMRTASASLVLSLSAALFVRFSRKYIKL